METTTETPYWVVGGAPSIGARLFRKFSGGGGGGGSAVAGVRMDFVGNTFATTFGFRLVPFGWPNHFAITIQGRCGAISTVDFAPNLGNTYIGISTPDGVASVTVSESTDVGGWSNFGFGSFARSDLQVSP